MAVVVTRPDAAPQLPTRREQVLIVARPGRDAATLCGEAAAEGHVCRTCNGVAGALAAFGEGGAGALVIAEEALAADDARALGEWLARQEPWSDLPVLLLTDAASAPLRPELAALVDSANVTLLQRPVPKPTLVSWIRSAVRARRRQHQVQALIGDLERAVRFGQTLASILGHDLRTPLAAARLSAELILRTSTDERALRPAGRILSSMHRMQRLIDQLLDYTRIREAPGLPLHPREADMGEICRAVIAEVENAEPDARVSFAEHGDPEGVWDPDRLAQLLTNLVTNAVRHGIPGGEVDVRFDGSRPDLVCVSVHNAGAIPRERLPSVFQPFRGISDDVVRQHGARALRTGEGLGLGLYIAREIARSHGGEIELATSEQAGTTFTATLPREAGRR